MTEQTLTKQDAKGGVRINGTSYYLDPLNITVLDLIRKDLRNAWDSWNLYCGLEGSGKSVKAMQDAQYVTGGKLTVDDICFTPSQLIERVQKQKKYHAVIYDEAITGYMSQSGINSISAELTKLAAQCRSRNLFVAVCMPSFFDLSKYIAIHRSDYLLQIEAIPDDEGERQRGHFWYFNRKSKQKIYLEGKRTYKLNKALGIHGKFTNWTGIDMDAYESKKFKALQQLGKRFFTLQKQRDKLIVAMSERGHTLRDIGKIIGIDNTVVLEIVRKAKEEQAQEINLA